MWIGKAAQVLIALHQAKSESASKDLAVAHAQIAALRSENEQLRATHRWFQLRLNAVEKERAQLIHAAIGVKIAIPEFVPVGEPAEAFHEMPDLSSVGGDARTDFPELEPNGPIGEGYMNLPGYTRQP